MDGFTLDFSYFDAQGRCSEHNVPQAQAVTTKFNGAQKYGGGLHQDVAVLEGLKAEVY